MTAGERTGEGVELVVKGAAPTCESLLRKLSFVRAGLQEKFVHEFLAADSTNLSRRRLTVPRRLRSILEQIAKQKRREQCTRKASSC